VRGGRRPRSRPRSFVICGRRDQDDRFVVGPPCPGRELDQAVEEQTAAAGAAPVEAEGELVEVVIEVLGGDAALVRSEQPALQSEETRWTAGIVTWAGSSLEEIAVTTCV